MRHGIYDILQSFDYYADGALRSGYSPYKISNSIHFYHDTYSYGSADSTYYKYAADKRRRPYETTFPTMKTAGHS